VPSMTLDERVAVRSCVLLLRHHLSIAITVVPGERDVLSRRARNPPSNGEDVGTVVAACTQRRLPQASEIKKISCSVFSATGLLPTATETIHIGWGLPVGAGACVGGCVQQESSPIENPCPDCGGMMIFANAQKSCVQWPRKVPLTHARFVAQNTALSA
jgi:hypothetical protein